MICCSYCSQCKLQSGKECTPDSGLACCGDEGMFLPTSVTCTMPGNVRGYCNAGVCSTRKCDLKFGYRDKLDTFCGVSDDYPCSAKCEASTEKECVDVAEMFRLLYSLEDGAFCTLKTGARGKCSSGSCKPLKPPSTNSGKVSF